MAIALALGACDKTPKEAGAPSKPECIAPAKPGGGFDLTCKLAQSGLKETKQLDKPMRVTYMPGGVGAERRAENPAECTCGQKRAEKMSGDIEQAIDDQQTNQRGLARAVMPDHPIKLTGRQRKRNRIEQDAVARAKRNAIERKHKKSREKENAGSINIALIIVNLIKIFNFSAGR